MKKSLLQTILADLLIAATGAAAVFVKNPQSQQTAGILINLASTLLQQHQQISATGGA